MSLGSPRSVITAVSALATVWPTSHCTARISAHPVFSGFIVAVPPSTGNWIIRNQESGDSNRLRQSPIMPVRSFRLNLHQTDNLDEASFTLFQPDVTLPTIS